VLVPFVLVAAALIPSSTHAQRQSLGFAISTGVGLPIGDLGDQANPGISLSVRREQRLGAEAWSLRGGLTFDRMGGNSESGVDNFQFITFATELVHHSSPRLYEFGGLGIYNVKTVFPPVITTAPSGFGRASTPSISETDIGIQAGLGYNFRTTGGARPFVEFQLVDVFTSGSSSAWFPIRFGIRI
jgi:hypothetical protein